MGEFFVGMCLVILAIGLVASMGGPSDSAVSALRELIVQMDKHYQDTEQQYKLINQKLDALNVNLEKLNVNNSAQ